MTTQWILFIVGYVAIAAAAAKKVHGETYTSYSYPSRDLHPGSIVLSFDSVKDLYNFADRLGLGPEDSDSKIISKRALSVLSRWRPFGNLGVRMNSVHKNPSRGSIKISGPGMDFVSAETRGSTRPLGQPLRWGRKR